MTFILEVGEEKGNGVESTGCGVGGGRLNFKAAASLNRETHPGACWAPFARLTDAAAMNSGRRNHGTPRGGVHKVTGQRYLSEAWEPIMTHFNHHGILSLLKNLALRPYPSQKFFWPFDVEVEVVV